MELFLLLSMFLPELFACARVHFLRMGTLCATVQLLGVLLLQEPPPPTSLFVAILNTSALVTCCVMFSIKRMCQTTTFLLAKVKSCAVLQCCVRHMLGCMRSNVECTNGNSARQDHHHRRRRPVEW